MGLTVIEGIEMWKIALAAVFICAFSMIPAQAASVQSKSGVRVQVSRSAQRALQCVIDYVERHGVRIKSMRGYGRGTVAHSLHPSGRALDINQVARGVTRPSIPHSIANAAGSNCGVISGGTWHNDDVGHWNIAISARR